MDSPPFTDIDSNITTTCHRKLPGTTNRFVPRHDPGDLGSDADIFAHAPADKAVARIGAARAPLNGPGEGRRQLTLDGGQALGLVELNHSVLLIPHSHGDIPISGPLSACWSAASSSRWLDRLTR